MPFVLTHPSDSAERIEGEAFYQLATYTLRDFSFHVRAFPVLPPCDAVALLSGEDSTGLVVWSGALALLEWWMSDEGRLDCLLSPALVIELGCGSGIATVGLFAQLQWHHLRRHKNAEAVAAPSRRLHLLATDGNPECVELAQRNVAERCDCTTGAVATASAAVLPWGDDEAVAQLLSSLVGCTDVSSSSEVAVVSADVLYDAAAVPLLISTVAAIATTCASALPLRWWLAYTPRSLTRAGNEHIFRTLVQSLRERGWSYELHPLPAGAVTTGFEERSDCDVPALRGCILVVRAGVRESATEAPLARDNLSSW